MLTIRPIGKPIAVVHGGEYDGEIISLVGNDEYDNNYGYWDDDDIDDKEFEIDDGKLVPVPSMDTRQVTYIAGPSGSGKSTYAALQTQKYRKLFPSNPIYIFSRLDSDPAFNNINPPPIRIKIDEKLLSHPIDVTKIIKNGALVIFDDIDSIQDDKLKKAVMKLEGDILEVGRHNNIYIIATSHLINPNDRKIGRTLLNEAHTLTVFPKSGSTYQINYALKNYFGLPKKQIEEILKLGNNSRWVTLMKSFPQSVIYENGCFLIS